MSSNAIYRGDNTASFGNNFITIRINNPLGYTISKAVFVTGKIRKTFDNPVSPLVVNFDSEETLLLKPLNIGHLVVYDALGQQKTCRGTVKFKTENGVICNEQQCGK